MTEKERKRFRNISLVQNISICLVYTFLLLGFVMVWATAEELFDAYTYITPSEGERIILQIFAAIAMFLSVLLLVFTIWQVVMWLMFWKATRRTRPFSKRRPWGITDQILKILAGLFGLWVTWEGLTEFFYMKPERTVDIVCVALLGSVSLFILITGIYLLLMLCRRRKELAEETKSL